MVVLEEEVPKNQSIVLEMGRDGNIREESFLTCAVQNMKKMAALFLSFWARIILFPCSLPLDSQNPLSLFAVAALLMI